MSLRTGIDRSHVLWALLCLSLALIPHAGRFSLWLLVCFGALAAWRVAGEYALLPLPDRRHAALWVVKQLLAVAAFIAIYITYQGQLGRDAGIALLTALLGLKMLELQHERDYYVVMFLAYFLVVTNFFYSQTITTALFMLVIVVTVTAGLVRFNTSGPALGIRACMVLATRYVAQALPLMVVAFFLFPRIPGPLWGLPQDSGGAVTGLSEEMTIGHITELGVSDEIAFRVAFDGELPPARQLYWRGPVMWHTDGRSWRGGGIGDGVARPVTAEGRTYRYTVTLEPHEQRWMFGIEAVTRLDEDVRQTSDYRLLAPRPIKRRLRYTLESRVDYRLPDITPEERAAALALPPGAHPRTHELAAALRARTPADDGVITRALRYFNEQAFVYTLTPQPLLGDSVDEFLFNTREGFCEHYAAAFVTLMRAAGIPARVVTGYQGGEFNSMSDYMIVRQRDAHAWAEVFLAERGWVRIDPTAAVAPERVSLGINEALPQQRLLPMLDAGSAAANAWRQVANAWDALNYGWSQWVLGYTPKRQRQLLDDAGLEDWDYGTLVITLTLALAALMLGLAFLVLRQRSERGDPAVIAYRQFCRKLARAGFERLPFEGPNDFARRVCRERSDLAADVLLITDTYTAIRYAGAKLSRTRLSELVTEFTANR